MEHRLRCNELKCRKELISHAVVTTCSHIFCLDCANQLQLSNQQDLRRQSCPVCDCQLTNLDDVVVANLNPTEDYKTSVLSGLSPQLIMECAGKALGFWTYQTVQDLMFERHSYKALSDRHSSLNFHLDKTINDANSAVSNLRNQISNLELEQDNLRRKNQELEQALKERTSRHNHTQQLYDKLKARATNHQMQSAVVDVVDESIQASVAANRFADAMQNQNMRPPPPPSFSNLQSTGMRRAASYPTNMAPSLNHNQGRGSGDGIWGAGLGGSRNSQIYPLPTPSSHRQQIPAGGTSYVAPMGFSNPQTNAVSRGPSHIPRASPRQGLAPISTNSVSSGFSGYGMSAGLKVSNPPGSVVNGSMSRSRVAHRAPSGTPSHPSPLFGSATPNTNMFSNGNDNFR